MRRLLTTILAIVVLSFEGWASDGLLMRNPYSVDAVPNVRLQDARQYVSDPSGLLSAGARDSINGMLLSLETSTGIETAVVMLPSIGGEDIFDFAHELFRTWGIGSKNTNNGLLILYVKDIRTVRFTTGYGLEGIMTDALAKRIQTTEMIPHFRHGDTDGGMVAGVRTSCQVLDGSMEPEDAEEDDGAWLAAIALLAGIIVMGVMVYLMDRRERKCKHCGHVALKKMSSSKYRTAGGHRHQKDIYVCGHCGHVTEKDTDLDDEGGGAAIAAGIALGAMMSGRRGMGGGSFGGHFGGGSTGGGGASSSW